MHISTLVRIGVFCLLLSACSSYLTTAENISNTKQSYTKILVIGRSKDNTARVKFENSVVEQLQESGIGAVSSYSLAGTKNITGEYTEAQIAQFKKKLISDGVDGAIVTNLINTEQYTDVIPGNSSAAYIPRRVGRFGRYYTYYPVTYWEPDQLTSGTKYIFESSFYRLADAPGDNIQWIGRFELKDPSSISKTAENYAKELVRALLKESIATNN
ncbi:MAG: hypothetical protein AAF717_08545 [Bacteroidota bacterium]